MKNQQDQVQSGLVSMKDTVDILGILAHIAIACVCPFVRSRTGKNYPGIYTLIALVVILYMAGAYRDQVVMTYFWVWFALLVPRRIQTFVYAKGTHTQFHGFPLFFRRIGHWAFVVEPFWVFGVGYLIRPESEALGLIWMSAAAGMAYVELIHRLLRQRRNDAIADKAIEMENEAAMARLR